jgi:hypothetical protein
MGIFGEEGIEDGIGDAIAQLIRVPLRDRLGGENIVLTRHGTCSVGSARHARKPL